VSTAQAVLYLVAVILLVLAGVGVRAPVSLALLGAAAFVLAFSLPTIATL
jgi:hypothetical protein